VTDDHPRRAAGISARGSSRRLTGAVVVGVVVTSLAAAISVLAKLSVGWALLVTFGVLSVSAITALWCHFLIGPAERRELDAGYTTTDAYDHVDQIDARSGLVVRRALTLPVLGERSAWAITEGVGAPVQSGRTPVGVIVRRPLPVTLLGIAIGAEIGAIGALALSFESMDESLALWLITVALVMPVVLLLGIMFLITSSTTKFYLPLLRSQFPTARVWPVNTSSLRVARNELLDPANAAPQRARPRVTSYLVLRTDALELWTRSGSDLLPLLSVPRERIASITSGYISGARDMGQPSIYVTITKHNGSTFRLTVTGVAAFSTVTKMMRQLEDANADIRGWWARAPRE